MKLSYPRTALLLITLVGLSALVGLWLFSIAGQHTPLAAGTTAPTSVSASQTPTAVAVRVTPIGPPYPIFIPTATPWPTLVVPDTPTAFPFGYITPTRTTTVVFLTRTPIPSRTPTPTPVGTPTPILTSTWNVYENSEQGFRIRYPSTFTFSVRRSVGPEILFDMTFYASQYQPGISQDYPLIGLHILDNPQQLSVDAWGKAHLFSSPGSGQYSLQFESYQVVRTLSIAGSQATRLAAVAPTGATGNMILLPTPDKLRLIDIYYFNDPPSIEPLFEVMAKTLERTK